MKPSSTLLATTLLLASCTDDEPAPVPQPDVLALPGSAYYPESLHAAADGTLYVGSLATGQVSAFANGALEPTVVIPAGNRGVTGVLVDSDDLWTCSVDTTFQTPTEVRHHTTSGALIASYPLGPQYFCNDLAFDAAGNLYATDSFSGNVLRLEPGGTAFAPFVQDPRFVPDAMGAFGLDGIAIDGSTMYVNKLDTSELFAIDLGTKAITPIAVSPALAGPDGMRLDDDGALLVIEGNAGRLSRVEVSGATASATAIATGLDMPTGVALARGSAWITEGQLGRLFTMQSPNLPFAVRRVSR